MSSVIIGTYEWSYTIKLDRSFIKSIEENDADSYIIKSILYLALDLKYNVVAEGIETKEQYEFLEKKSVEQSATMLTNLYKSGCITKGDLAELIILAAEIAARRIINN